MLNKSTAKWATGFMIFSAALALGLSGCKREEKISFSYTPDGYIWFKNSVIQLRFDDKMYCKVFYKDTTHSINDAIPGELPSKPSHFIVLNGKEVKDFAVDYSNIKPMNIKTEFGAGKRLILKGTTMGPENCEIEKSLTIELYDKYPNVAITYATYKNLGAKELSIDKVYSNYYRLDASLAGPSKVPYGFWSFQGGSIEWGRDYVFGITDGFAQENWMGLQPETRKGGGVPVVDLWTKEMGLAIAHIEPIPKLVFLPVEVQPDKKVMLSVRNDLSRTLPPEGSYSTLKTIVVAHSLDYFDVLSTYSKLMQAQGLKMKEPSAEAYAAIWCGWGYEEDFTIDDILGTLPKVKELGIHWVVLDDRWWDRYGDWNPREYNFPGGEAQIKEFVDTLHKEGFKVKIWWVPTTAQPPEVPGVWPSVTPGISDVAKNHPEWLIMDKEGNYPKCDRKMYFLCPSVPEVQDYIRNLTKKFIKDWDFDGHKLDAFWTVPPCYNPEHHHSHPAESFEDLPKLLKIIYETTKSIKPNSVTEICNCGTAQDFFQEPYIDQPVTSDPVGSWQVRKRIKVFKALMGPRAAVYADHVELTEIRFTEEAEFDVGKDFASAVGTGGVVGTKFTWPGGPEEVRLTPEKEVHWKKWISIYNDKMLSKGEYLNLYDIAYDEPETHTVKKGDTLYYAFYAKSWKGNIELRRLKDKEYSVYDYVNDVDMGEVAGPTATISLSFKDYLLIECIPTKSK